MDYVVFTLVLLLTIFGLVMLASASSELGKTKFNDSYFYVKHQLFRGLLPGMLGFAAALFTYYRRYQKFSFFFMLLGIALLILVFTPYGLKVNNAQRWIRFGEFSFQPAEIMKILFIVYLAAWLSNARSGRNKKFIEGFVPFILLCGAVAALLIFQPATSIVAILMIAALGVYFASGAPVKYVALAVILGVVSFTLLIYLSQGHRLERITTYFSPQSDAEKSGYHMDRALTTLGSGGLLGIGFGQSTIKSNLPARIDDSIFAVIAGELGFVGAGILVFLFAFLALRIFWLAKNARDRFGQLILIGFGLIIFLQSFVNMAAISGLLPLTGIPLPFISYGGTALAVMLTMSGIILNISKYT